MKIEKDYTLLKSAYHRSWFATQFRTIPVLVWLILIVIGLSLSGEIGSIFAWVLIALWVLRGPDEAIEGLLLSLLLIVLNPELNSSGEFIFIARWLILFEASARVFLEWFLRKPKFPSWFKYLLVFVIYVGFATWFVSWWKLISFLKLTTFTLVVLVTYFGIKLGNEDWVRNLIAFGATISLLSLPLIFTSVGYLVNGYQFQGILIQPQTYGVIISISLAAAVGRWLLNGDSKISIPQVFILVVMGVTMILSVARTGYFALILAMVISVFYWKYFKRMLTKLVFNPLTYFVIALLFVAAWILSPKDVIQEYIFERDASVYSSYELPIGAESSLVNQLLAARSRLAIQSLDNYKSSPMIGVGFGLPSFQIPRYLVSTIWILPVSLPYDKGFIGTAMLEEVGIIGIAIFLLMLYSQFRPILQSRSVELIILFLTALFINFGEFSYFSMGSIGLFEQIAIASALVGSEKLIANSGYRSSE